MDNFIEDRETSQKELSQTEEIEYIPPVFKDILKFIPSLSRLSMSHTFFAWRTGSSDYFIYEVLLPRLYDKGIATVIVPLYRSLRLENLKRPTFYPIKKLKSQSLSYILNSEEFIYIFDGRSSEDISKIIEQVFLLTKEKNKTNSIRQIIILLEVFGPFDEKLNNIVRLLMRDGLINRIVLWLHAEIVNIPTGFLDQFNNHIILMPSRTETDILSQIQPISFDKIDLKGNRHNIAIIGGDCLPSSWEIVNLSGNSELAKDRERKRLQELLHDNKNKLLLLETDAAEFIDKRNLMPDKKIGIKNIKILIKNIEQELKTL